MKSKTFQRCVDRYRAHEAIALNHEPEVNSSLDLYEMAFRAAWKSLANQLEIAGYDPQGPRSTFELAVLHGLIEDRPDWVEMLEDRNRIAGLKDRKERRLLALRARERYLVRFDEIEAALGE